MVILEIAAQGVRGFAPVGGRLALRPGYNVAAADGPQLRRLLESLLYPDAPGEPAPRAAPGQAGPAARAGLTVVGSDGVTLRVVRDLGGGAQLQRFDPDRRAFLNVSLDARQIAELLQQGTGVPPRENLLALLSLAAADLPSRQAAPSLGAGPAPSRRALAPEEARTRLAALREELEKAQAADKLQYQLDGLQSRLFKLEEALRSGEQIRERLRGAEEAVAALRGLEEAAKAVGDPEARLAAFERATARRDETLTRIGAERDAVAEREARGPPAPFWTQRDFALGLVGAAASIAVGLATDWHVVALLAIPAAGYSAFLGLRWAGDAEEAERSARRYRLLEERERKAREAYERDGADIRGLMKAIGVESVGDLRDALARLARAWGAAEEERKNLAEWEGLRENQEAAAEKASLQEQIGEIERKLTEEAGGYVRDPRAVEAEIQRLEAEVEVPSEPAVQAAPSAPAGDPLKATLERAAAELGGTSGAALRAVQPRLLQLLPALSGQRFTALIVDERGNLTVQGGGRATPLGALPPADRDLCYVVLKLAFMERALAAGRGVALVDDALGGFAEPVRRSLARVLKQLGRTGQVLHATADPIFREAADHCG